MEIRLLGPLEVLEAERLVTPTAPKVRQVLALLALNANRPVGAHRLVEELWGENPPMSWATTLQTYIYHLRKWLQGHAAIGMALDTRPGGYQLSLPETNIDLFCFQQLAEHGMADMTRGHHRAACDALEAAMLLWRDRALDDLNAGPVLQTEIVRLHALRRMSLEALLNAEMALGRYQQVIVTIEAELADEPTHEGLYSKLLIALYRCGRRREALARYQQIRVVLAEELGLDPGPELLEAHRAVLDDTAYFPAVQDVPDPAAAPDVLPAHLPPDCQQIGRESELSWFRELHRLAPTHRPVVVSVIGPPGVGATAFCIHAAHTVRADHPDGQFYADLGRAGAATAVLAMFLRATGMETGDIPATVEDRLRAFRSWTANRRVLVVLDGVRSTEQLKELLPTGPGSLAIVCSHHRLCGQELSGTIRLNPLSHRQSGMLLFNAVGADLLERQPHATTELIEMCAGSPVSLWAAATQLLVHPHWDVAWVVQRAQRDRSQPAIIASDGLDITQSVAARCNTLPPTTRSALQHIVPHRGPLSLVGAANLMGIDVDAAEEILDDLVDYQLAEVNSVLEEPTGSPKFHYQVHPHVLSAYHGPVQSSGRPPIRGRLGTQQVAIA